MAMSTASTYEFPSLRFPQAAEHLNISQATLWRLIQAGEGPNSYLVGKGRFFRESDLVDWLEGSCRQTTQAG